MMPLLKWRLLRRSLVCDVNIMLLYVNMSVCVITGETPLHLAARYSRADAAKKLLDAGASCLAQDNNGRTPLHAAIAADARGVFQVYTQVLYYKTLIIYHCH